MSSKLTKYHSVFYMVVQLWACDSAAAVKKLGIVYSRHPKKRIREYQLFDNQCIFYKVALFPPGVDIRQIERNCLIATRRYMKNIEEFPNSEARYSISCKDLWEICSEYFPPNTKYLNHRDIMSAPDALFPPGNTREPTPEYFDKPADLMFYEPRNKLVLRDYQDIILVDRYLNEHNDGILHMAPGTGKSKYAIGWLNFRRFNRVIVFVPSIALKEQWEEDLTNYYFGKVIKDTSFTGIFQIIVSTYLSSHKLQKEEVDAVVLDEIHHTAPINNDNTRTSLAIETRYRLGLTATMRYGPEDIFNNIIYTLPIREAIERKIIIDYKAYIARIDDRDADYIATKIESPKTYKDIELIIAAYMTLKLLSEGIIKKAFILCNKVPNADLIDSYITLLLETGMIDMDESRFIHYTVHSNTTRPEIKERLENFVKAEKGIITSVYMCVEGVDFPCVDCICVAENMESTIRIVQSLMRGSRYYPGKSRNHIVLPVVRSDAYESNNFQKIKQVIKVMDEVDEGGIYANLQVMSVSLKDKTIIKSDKPHSSSASGVASDSNEDLDIDFLRNIKIELLNEKKQSLSNFIKKLKGLHIKNMIDYRAAQADPKTELPYQPEREFSKFQWSMLDTQTYYTEEECHARIKELLDAGVIRGSTPSEKNKFLAESDSRIPSDLYSYYRGSKWPELQEFDAYHI